LKIAIDCRGAEKRSGVGVATDSMVRQLLGMDTRNEYLLIRNGKGEAVPPNCAILDTERQLTEHPRGDLWFHRELPSLLVNAGVDVFWGPGYLVPLGGKGFRRVVTFCDLSFHEKKSTFPILTRTYFRLVFRRAAMKADRILAISRFTKDEIGRVYGPECFAKTKVIHLDCDPAFRVPHLNTSAVRAKFGITRPYLLFVGNLEPRKNLNTLIEAFRSLKREHGLPHMLVIVGQKAWMYSGIFASILREGLEGDVLLTGYVEQAELPGLYAGADAFVYPSLYEGFGIPVLEAMAAGVPVVASDRASIPEIAGGAASLFDAEKPEMLCQALLKVLRDPGTRETLIERGRRRAQDFSWRRSAEELLGELQACG
jgi:glycosyltransferase involved in cell wall biosynthesis